MKISRLEAELKQREIDHLNWANKVADFLVDESIQTFNVQTDFHKCGYGKWFYGKGKEAAISLVPAFIKLIPQSEAPHKNLHNSVEELEIILTSPNRDRQEAVTYFKENTQKRLVEIQSILKKSVAQSVKARERMAQRVASKENTIRITSIIIVSIFVISLITVSLLISNSILKPLNHTIALLKDIAMGEGDLRKRLPMRKFNCSGIKDCGNEKCPEFGQTASCWDTVGSNAPGEIHCPSILKGKIKSCTECKVMQDAMVTEIDELSAWFNTFIGKISQLIKLNKDNISVIASSSEEQSATASQIASSTGQMSSQTGSIAAAAEQSSTNLNVIASRSEEMNTSVSTVAAAIEEMSATVNEIAKNCNQESQIANVANSQVKSANTTMQTLSQSANEIGKILDVINNIADQTNLLALNATIEAASAGESGKGFAVVANEVKELAKQTAQATEEISNQITVMRSNTDTSVKSIEEITSIIDQVNTISQTIAAAVEEQSATVNEISRNISQVSSASGEVSKNVQESATGLSEISGNIAGFTNSITEINNGMSHIKGSSGELASLAEKLRASVGQFKV